MKATLNLLLIAVLAITLGCQNSKNAQNQAAQQADSSRMMVGNDKDEHGCRASAGYTWSEVKRECIRVFEAGLKMISVKDPNTTSAAYLVFSSDSTRVELFMPNISNHPILQREGKSNVWSDLNNQEYRISIFESVFVILQNNDVIYKQDLATLPLKAVFDGSDGKTKMRYQVSVNFYQVKKRAMLFFDGKTYDLAQYVTADGYGYKNENADLRGRGREATLSFKDGLVLKLNEKLK